MNNYKFKNKKGFTYIESVVFLFIFSLVVITFYQVFSLGTRYIVNSKNRLGAISVANEKMEIDRNLKYKDVGTVGGFISGNIPQTENVIENNQKYKVQTEVSYRDDPFDGTLNGSPNDTDWEDYKIVKVIVSWDNGAADRGNVFIVSQFSPPGLESVNATDGVLSINILLAEANGGNNGVAGFNVHIENSDLGISEDRQTDSAGNITIIGLKQSIQKYKLTVSKTGYKTVTTFPPYPITSFNPTDVNATVIAGTINNESVEVYKIANLKISAVDYLDNPVSNVHFKLVGGRVLGTTNDQPPLNVYEFNKVDTTGADGTKEYKSVGLGQYTLGLDSSEAKYSIVGMNQISPFNLVAGITNNIKIKVADRLVTGYLVNVLRKIDNSPLNSASVELKNTNLNYDRTVVADNSGMAFFPTANDTKLLAGTYDITIKAEGYSTYTGTATVVNGKLTSSSQTLTAK